MSDLLLEQQAVFDVLNFDQANGYKQLAPKPEKVRHVMEHSVKAAGKLAVGVREVVTGEVIPSLAMYRSQLINIMGLKLYDITRVEAEFPVTTPADLASDSFMSVQKDRLAIANGKLADYVEPLEHGDRSSRQQVQIAAQGLHIVTINLAGAFEVDLPDAHQLFLENLLGGPIPTEV